MRRLPDGEAVEQQSPGFANEVSAPWVGETTVCSRPANLERLKVEPKPPDETGFQFVCLSRQRIKTQFHEQAWKFITARPEIIEAAANVRHRVYEISGGESLKVEPR